MAIEPRHANPSEARLWDAITVVCNTAMLRGEADVQAVLTVLLNLTLNVAHGVEGIAGVDQAIKLAEIARADMAEVEAAKQRGLN